MIEAARIGPAARALWAKSDRDGGEPVSLIDHATAAAMAARLLLDGPLAPAAGVVADDTGLGADDARRLCAVLVGLHDLGKATPGFQSIWPAGAARVGEAGLAVTAPRVPAPHGFVSAGEIARDLVARGVRRGVAARLARAVGAHHGTFPWSDLPVADDGDDPSGAWAAARAEIVAAVVGSFAPEGLPLPGKVGDAAVAVLAGLTTFADWLASDRTVLGSSAPGGLSPEDAREAVSRVPLTDLPVPAAQGFGGLFGFTPRGAQVVVDADVAPVVAGGEPSLVVIEDATGAGKTEAAFQVVHAGLRAGLRGAYVALPTRATSNQAYRRLLGFLAANVPGTSEAVLLHSSALMTADFAAVRTGRHPLSPRLVGAEPGGADTDDAAAGLAGAVQASGWFCRPKRGLLATFAVGTVDQAMLGVLGSRFATLRLLGLTAKTLVLDEVHAYDRYMITVIERLISWAAACGCNVVILSATLPADMKRRLVAAFSRDAVLAPPEAHAYPSVTHATGSGRVRVFPVQPAERSRRAVGLERLRMKDADDPGQACAAEIERATSAGAEVAVVVNTVARAQALYRDLVARMGPDRVRILHSRFRAREREDREERLFAAYGPDGVRPGGSVVVATQVIEQSLDLDFDLVVSDLAPVDLLLQRIGRLQRHHRPGQRPAGYDEDACRVLLLTPPAPGGVPAPDGGTSRVYDLGVLLRTHVALEGVRRIRIPEDVRPLVEAVYAETPFPGTLPSALDRAVTEAEARRRRREAELDTEAANRVLSAPGDGVIQTELAQHLDDDDEPAPNGPARTRLGVGCAVVVLRADEAELAHSGDPRDPATVRALLERSLVVSHPGLVAGLPRSMVPAPWRRVGALAHHRLLQLDVDGCVRNGGAMIRLDEQMGLTIDWTRK